MISGALVFAQEKDAEKQQQSEMEEQMRIRKQMLEQQQEQMKQQQEQMKQQQEQMKEIQKQVEVRIKDLPYISAESLKLQLPILMDKDLKFGTGKSFDYHFFNSFDQGNRSQLILRKNFNGTTDTSKGEFDVEEDIRNFRCMVSGTVESGEIFIRLQYPDGKVFKELTINSSADINFNQSVSIGEGEKSRHTGKWSYVIKADKAVGQYMLQISTN